MRRRTRPKDLTTRVAQPSRAGWRSSHQWRSVATGLTPTQLRYIYSSIAQGVWSPDFFELAEEIEERDLHYRGVIQQRRLRAAGASIDVLAASDDPADVAIADDVRQRVLQGAAFHRMLLNLLDAIGKGVSCIEVVWELHAGRWQPATYHRIDPRWLVWGDDGETPLLVQQTDGVSGLVQQPTGSQHSNFSPVWSTQASPLEPAAKWVYHAHHAKSGLAMRGGLAFAVASLWLLKSIAVRDWWAFSETYGLPLRVGKYGPNASTDEIETLVEAVNAIASDAGCVIPDTMMIEFMAAGTAGGSGGGSGAGAHLFSGQTDWCDSQISKAVVGQTMTTDDGSSKSQAEVHAEVRDDLVDDDVRQICETLSQTVVRAYCELNHAPRAAGWPRIGVPTVDALDVEMVTGLAKAGLRIPAAWVRERAGIPMPTDNEEVIGQQVTAARPGAAPDDDPEDDAREMSSVDAAIALLAEASAWGELTADLVEPVEEALRAATDADDFLSRVDVGVPEQLAADLAQRAFATRVDSEIS